MKRDWSKIEKFAKDEAAKMGHRVECFTRRRETPGVRMADCETCFGCCWVAFDNSGGKAGGRILKYQCGTKEARGVL